MNIEDYQQLFSSLQTVLPQDYLNHLKQETEQTLLHPTHGHFNQWKELVETLPTVKTEHVCFDQATISIGTTDELDLDQQARLRDNLLQLSPWRKGPFSIFGTKIDSEWHSDMKWDRLATQLPSLEGANILDVGCGNGYFMLRMKGAGARCVVGIDPSLLFVAQYQSITGFLDKPLAAHILPLPFDKIASNCCSFDFVFSMGVLYHRRDPHQHLQQLKEMLRPGGYLILETIILNNDTFDCLVPENRYAGMRNVWTIPTPSLLENWLKETGWSNARCINQQSTKENEQHSTDWMRGHSLKNFLDSNNLSLTIEGYPAPVRGIWLVQK